VLIQRSYKRECLGIVSIEFIIQLTASETAIADQLLRYDRKQAGHLSVPSLAWAVSGCCAAAAALSASGSESESPSMRAYGDSNDGSGGRLGSGGARTSRTVSWMPSSCPGSNFTSFGTTPYTTNLFLTTKNTLLETTTFSFSPEYFFMDTPGKARLSTGLPEKNSGYCCCDTVISHRWPATGRTSMWKSHISSTGKWWTKYQGWENRQDWARSCHAPTSFACSYNFPVLHFQSFRRSENNRHVQISDIDQPKYMLPTCYLQHLWRCTVITFNALTTMDYCHSELKLYHIKQQ